MNISKSGIADAILETLLYIGLDIEEDEYEYLKQILYDKGLMELRRDIQELDDAVKEGNIEYCLEKFIRMIGLEYFDERRIYNGKYYRGDYDKPFTKNPWS